MKPKITEIEIIHKALVEGVRAFDDSITDDHYRLFVRALVSFKRLHKKVRLIADWEADALMDKK